MSLTKYREKRSFNKTSEPKGRKHASNKNLEFVVQKHDASRLHYDFRLELDGVLKSWAVPKGPSLDPKQKRLAVEVEDHPYSYRTFEGEIPEGNYGAGDVIVWDKGTYEPSGTHKDEQASLKKGLKEGHLSFILHGTKLKGEFALIKNPHMEKNAWLLVKKEDKYATPADVTEQVNSALSQQKLPRDENKSSSKANLDSLPASKLKGKLKPMLATLTDKPFDDPDFIYEIKWDGYRAVAEWDTKKAELYSRNGTDFSKKYQPVTDALKQLPKSCVLDGEIVMVDKEGRSHFELLQNYERGAKGELQYQVFDIINLDGKDLTSLPLIERKQILKEFLANCHSVLRYSDHVEEKGRQFFEKAEQANLEGIMAKASSSRYRPGSRSKQWLKVKTHKRQEVVIGGYTEPKGSRKYIGALLVGIYEDKKFKYVGHVGGGIPTDQLEPLRHKLESISRKTSPFNETVRPNAKVHWVTPKMLCEVSFSEWTKDKRLRQPIFMGLRNDKSPKEVTQEVPMPSPTKSSSYNKTKFEFTNRSKVFFPENKYTKGDLIDYYESVSSVMLPYLKNRPCNLLRHPSGYKGSSFFQKDMKDSVPDWVTTEAVYSDSNKKDLHYYVCKDKQSLLYMVQLGCIEINPWSSKLGALDKPSWGVIDLDPEGVSFAKVVEVAQAVHALCQELDIPSYPKTSGKSGLHIFIPMNQKYTYEQVRQFCQLLASIVHDRTESLTSLERDPKKRQKKIYLDYLQNRESQTLAAPYSVRPTKDASVSTPLEWDEVNSSLNPRDFTIKNTVERLDQKGDLWKPVTGKGIDLKKVIKKLEQTGKKTK